jgi:hypothetical protein
MPRLIGELLNGGIAAMVVAIVTRYLTTRDAKQKAKQREHDNLQLLIQQMAEVREQLRDIQERGKQVRHGDQC